MLKILRGPRVWGADGRTGQSRSAVYAAIQRGLFIKPVKIGARAAGYPEHEVDAVVAARIAGASDEEIKKLVATLEASRRKALELAA